MLGGCSDIYDQIKKGLTKKMGKFPLGVEMYIDYETGKQVYKGW